MRRRTYESPMNLPPSGLKMPTCQTCAFYVIFAVSLSGCATVPEPHPGGSDARAIAILQQAQETQGSQALHSLHDVNVRFEGKWNSIVARLQPVLVDDHFRGTSEERYLIRDAAVGQTHVGPSGTKYVFRDKNETRVWYDGKENADAEVRDAAALVADNYRMFLMGPEFFSERSVILQYLGTEDVDGANCDNLLAQLKPGLGNSAEDRVVISIDSEHHWIRRVRITLNGLESTRGAVADVYLRDPIRIAGVLWPTNFYEELKRPFDSDVHHWRLTAIDLDRGLQRDSLEGPGFKGPATVPAGQSLRNLKDAQKSQ